MSNSNWVFATVIIAFIAGLISGFYIKPNQTISWPVATIAQYLCKNNDGPKTIKLVNYSKDRYDIVCNNGAHFLNQHITLESHRPSGPELLD